MLHDLRCHVALSDYVSGVVGLVTGLPPSITEVKPLKRSVILSRPRVQMQMPLAVAWPLSDTKGAFVEIEGIS